MLLFLLVSAAMAATDCTTLDLNLRDFQLKNKKNQETVVNFAQQISDRLRADQAVILQDMQSKLEEKEKENPALTSKIVLPIVTNSLSPLTKMADDTDTVLNAAYDNNDIISKDLDTLIKQIQDCTKP